MIDYFADLHIHIGRTESGEAIKIASSKRLTIRHILTESSRRKGLDMIALVDCASPPVLAELKTLVDSGVLSTVPGGGLKTDDGLVVLLAAELGASSGAGEAHFLSYLPDLSLMAAFSRAVSPHVTNIRLSSQKTRLTPAQLLAITEDHGGFFILAHAFTPHKGYFGACSSTLSTAFTADEIDRIPGIELGLSADISMASSVSEIAGKSFISNSDAHSLPKIAREFNLIRADQISFASLLSALRQERGSVVTNFGLDPRLGKYFRTTCAPCGETIPLTEDRLCPRCGGRKITVGVADRLAEVADCPPEPESDRYVYQVPLEYVPGVGPKLMQRLLDAFGDERTVLHQAEEEQLRRVAPEAVASWIMKCRRRDMNVGEGGGGAYGRLLPGR